MGVENHQVLAAREGGHVGDMVHRVEPQTELAGSGGISQLLAIAATVDAENETDKLTAAACEGGRFNLQMCTRRAGWRRSLLGKTQLHQTGTARAPAGSPRVLARSDS